MGTGAYPFRLPDRLRDVFGRRKFSALAQASKVFPRKGLAISKRDQYVMSGLHMRFNRDRMFYAGCHFCDYIKQLDQHCFGVLACVKKLSALGFKKIKLEAFIAEVKADLGL